MHEAQVLTHIHPSALRFAPKVAPLCSPALQCPGTHRAIRCPEPLCALKALPLAPEPLASRRRALPPPSSLLRAHAPILNPPTAYGHSLGRWVCAGCCQPLLGVGPSRRFLCESFSACLSPYPGCSHGALTRFFPQDNGLPDVRTRSAPGNTHTATSVWSLFRGCSYSIIFRPADLLAPHVAPTAAPLGTRQTGLLHPRISRFVTSPSRGYANRPLSGN